MNFTSRKASATASVRTILLAVAVGAAMTTAAVAQQKPAAPGGQKILVLNRQAILQLSKAGLDIGRQVNAYRQQIRGQLQAQAGSLQAEQRSIQQQLAILSPAAKKQKVDAFEAKVRSLQAKEQTIDAKAQVAVAKANQQIAGALGPILNGIMQERGATIMLDRQVIVMATNSDMDVTNLAIQRLNQKMPGVKVDFVNAQVPNQGKPAGQ